MKYIVRPKAIAGDDEPLFTGISVIEESKEPIETGLYNADGDMIYRVKETVPFGFRAKS